jgi:hypothetical protein
MYQPIPIESQAISLGRSSLHPGKSDAEDGVIPDTFRCMASCDFIAHYVRSSASAPRSL